jgi:hypothetical protein
MRFNWIKKHEKCIGKCERYEKLIHEMQRNRQCIHLYSTTVYRSFAHQRYAKENRKLTLVIYD